MFGSNKKTNQSTSRPPTVVPCPGGCGGRTNGGKCADCYRRDNPWWQEELPK